MISGSGPASDFRVQFRAPTFQTSDEIEGIASQDWQEKDEASPDGVTSRLNGDPQAFR